MFTKGVTASRMAEVACSRVAPVTLSIYGAISGEVAAEMAVGVQRTDTI